MSVNASVSVCVDLYSILNSSLLTINLHICKIKEKSVNLVKKT